MQYLINLKIERAKELLTEDNQLMIKDIAEIVGYPDPYYFSKVFKKKVGCWPSEYKSEE